MIKEGHPCLDLAQQMQAIENAIANAKKALIHDHITHCIEQSLKSPGPKRKAALKEFEAIAEVALRRFDRARQRATSGNRELPSEVRPRQLAFCRVGALSSRSR